MPMASIPEVLADTSAEDAVDDGIDGAIEWRRRLYEGTKTNDIRAVRRKQ